MVNVRLGVQRLVICRLQSYLITMVKGRLGRGARVGRLNRPGNSRRSEALDFEGS